MSNIRLRLRHPGGQASINISESSTVGDLKKRIAEQAGFAAFDLKHGYPPKSLSFQTFPEDTPLLSTGIKLDGEQLFVSRSTAAIPPNVKHNEQHQQLPNPTANPSRNEDKDVTTQASFTFAGIKATSPVKLEPAACGPDTTNQDAPEIPLPSLGATLLLRIMPDDNSCLFRAFNTAFFGLMDNMHELRSIIAQNVQTQPETYSAVVLDHSPDDYCRWIQTDDAWGGSIELDILSKHFDIEICSIDVQTLRVDTYNEGRPSRCIVVYSGIHYDVVALSPSDPPNDCSITSPDFDTKIFDSADEPILQAAVELCKVLRGRHYYTDTANFNVRCNLCGTLLMGEKGAAEHAAATGHTNFGESK